ncbi:hypothetical protein GEV27_07560 [Aeromicrobium sp. S22]|uniref:hypothetical protein n=1 Tax=Aeromicrobium sp. S22 TaxID=2662029 RepID=UPI00129DD98C|nr:hypothetical protein [Aeromicrobium sp. S22]MRK01379.1 hypothetical protein [Aeromicrobium sp. S22]
MQRVRATAVLARIERSLIDGALVVDTATDASADAWPADFVEAFRHLRYDGKYGVEERAGVYGLFDHLTQDQLDGIANSVKGTVLEIRVRDMAQAGELPGMSNVPSGARLSGSLTQTGHDVEIMNGSGEIVEKIQVKAGSWTNFSGRMDEYANDGIPVAVTSEAAGRAAEAGRSADVIDTGISAADLSAQTAELVDNLGLGHAIDEIVPEMALVMLTAAAAVRLKSGQSPTEVRQWVTGQLQELGVANAAGLAISVMSGVAVLRPVAALGAKWTLARVRTGAEVSASVATLRQRLRATAKPPDV